jgi:ribonuclease VapC
VSGIVLDASALLALLNEEPGADVVVATLPGAAISAVNLSEVYAKLDEVGIAGSAARSTLEELGLAVHTFDAEQALATGMLRSRTSAFGLSLGDRACLALGLHLGLPVLTADRVWRDLDPLDLGVEVRPVR